MQNTEAIYIVGELRIRVENDHASSKNNNSRNFIPSNSGCGYLISMKHSRSEGMKMEMAQGNLPMYTTLGLS